MPAEIITLPIWQARTVKKEKGVEIVSTVSKAEGWQSDLSPFKLGPCKLYRNKNMADGYYWSENMENAWQYSKVYPGYALENSQPSKKWWLWAIAGWENPVAVRYPMGRGKVPLFSYWDGNLLSYVNARKVIYGPLYAEAVQKTKGWKELKKLYKSCKKLVLLDYDVRNTQLSKETMTQVLNNPDKKMGHAFVLKMLLTADPALEQMELRS
jgi:hypothetical protein